jgi:hypothetical protein
MQLKHYWLTERLSARSAETLAKRISGLGELSLIMLFATKLKEPVDRVLDVFPEQPPWDPLHIIVQKPLYESYVDLYDVEYPANVNLSLPPLS